MVLSINIFPGLLSFPSLSGSSISVAVEDLRHSIIEDKFSDHALMWNDQLDPSIKNAIGNSSMPDVSEAPQGSVHVGNDSFSPDLESDGTTMSLPVVGDHLRYFRISKMYIIPVRSIPSTVMVNHLLTITMAKRKHLPIHRNPGDQPRSCQLNRLGWIHSSLNHPNFLQSMMQTLGQKPLLLQNSQ